jgi:hypothetical protein
MAENDPTEFVCPGCGSGYKVVRVKADADLPHRLIRCRPSVDKEIFHDELAIYRRERLLTEAAENNLPQLR